MSRVQREFAKANRGKGLSNDQLQALHGIGSHKSQEALDFVLTLLQRNDPADVSQVMQRALSALDGPDGMEGVSEVLSAAEVTGFPQASAAATRWVLQACLYAAENYNTSPEEVEEPVPVLL